MEGPSVGSYREVYGDLLKLAEDGHFDAIAHQCNLYCNMGKGIAREIYLKFPAAVLADKQTGVGDISKLGSFTAATIYIKGGHFNILNVYCQRGMGSKNGPSTDYSAMEEALSKLNKIYRGKYLGLPLLGAGMAGGDWSKIKSIILNTLSDVHVIVVKYKP